MEINKDLIIEDTGRDLFSVANVQDINEAGLNLNDFKKNGVYWFNGGVTPINIPEFRNGFLFVYSTSPYCKQIWVPYNYNGGYYLRTYDANNWTAWTQFLPEQRKSAITIFNNGFMGTTSTDNSFINVTCDQLGYQYGNQLTKTNDGKVLIGANVNLVKITASCNLTPQEGATYQQLRIQKNNSDYGYYPENRCNIGWTNAVSISTFYLPVSQGDTISMRIFNRLKSSIYIKGLLTVEVVN